MSNRSGISPDLYGIIRGAYTPVDEYNPFELTDEEKRQLAGANPAAQQEGRTWGEAASDTGAAVMGGFASLGGSLTHLGDTVTGGIFDIGAREAFDNASKFWEDAKSDELKRQKAVVHEADGFVDTVGAMVVNPATIADLLAGSLPHLLPVGIAAKVGKGLALAQGMKAGPLTAEAAAALGTKAAGVATTTSMVAGGVLEGADAGSQAYNDAIELAKDKTPEELISVMPAYKKLIDEGMSHKDAVAGIAYRAGLTAQMVATPIAILASKVTGSAKLESDLFTGAGIKGWKNGALGVAKEGAEEVVQEGGNRFGQNVGVNEFADPTRGYGDDVADSAAMGLVAGVSQGGGIYGLNAVLGRGANSANAQDDGIGDGIDAPVDGSSPSPAPLQLQHNPERMITMPDGTTAWESELADLNTDQAAKQHPAYASPIVSTGDQSNPDDRFKFELNTESLRTRIQNLRAKRREEMNRVNRTVDFAPVEIPAASAAAPQNIDAIEFTPPALPESSRFSLAPLEQSNYENGVDFTPQSAKPSPGRVNELAAGVEQAISNNIDSARNARMPENLKDTRLLRNRYRSHLNNVAESLEPNAAAFSSPDSLLDMVAKNGGLNAEAWAKEGVDPADAKTSNSGFSKVFRKNGGMTPDDLAEFAQQNGFTGFADAQGNLDAGAALNAVNDELSGNKRYSLNDESALQAAQNAPAYVSELKGMGSPKEIKAAISKALNGEKLGARQLKIVQAALDNSNAHTRDSSAIQEKWGERSKTMLANRGNKHLNEWRNRDEHADNATTHEAALNEIMVDAIKNYGIDADKVKAAYDKYSAKYTDMNSLVAAMTSWVSASKPNTNEHLSYEQQNRKAELPRESSNQRGAIEGGAGLPSSSQAAESGRAGSGIESGPSSQSGNDSAGRDAGLRQSIDSGADENQLPPLAEGFEKSLLRARPLAKKLGIPNYNQMKLAELVTAIRTKYSEKSKAEAQDNQEPIKKESPAATRVTADSVEINQEPVKEKPKSIEGKNIDGDWAEFSDDSGSLKIPRAEMPQIKAEHRGAMVNFLNARGVEHQEENVPADSLKPTQAEFSREKVAKAKGFEGGNRSILISSDNHVLDGHHQWMAARDNAEDVKVIRLDAPIKQLVDLAHEFPSSTTDAASEQDQSTDSTEPLTTKGTKLADKATEAIADFGEKLEGAKKDTRSLREKLSDKEIDTAAVPLSKSFPQPDYEKLAAAGVPHEVLAFVAQLRAEIKAKPKRNVKSWAATVDAMRSFANDLLDGSISIDDAVNEMKVRGSYVKSIPDIIAIAKEVLPSQIKDLGGYKLEHHHYTLYRDKENVFKWVVTNTEGKAGEFRSSRGNESRFDTKDEALAFIKSQVTTIDADGKPLAKFDIWSIRGENGYWVGKKLGTNKYIELKKFDSSREARDFIVSNNDELSELLKKKKQTGSERRAEQNERVGKDYRRGVNVTQDLFNETFGFRGVQFGTYVNNDKRQQDLNNAYDGLLDLADVLGIPPQAISLNGELGLAFGARGNGGKDAASAHYESKEVVINLTKANGAGSLAHEWWHALDNYFAKQGELKSKSGEFITELNRPKRKEIIRDGRRTIVDADPNDFGVRPEVYDAFKNIVNVIKNETKLYERSNVLDGRKTADYWTTTRELTARAFERFVIDELKTKGYESDYLASILPKDAWDSSEALFGNSTESYPYPTDEEAAKTNAAYATLFDTIESKQTEKGTLLYKLDTKNPKSISRESAQAVIDRISKDWKVKVKINLIGSIDELPDSVKSRLHKTDDEQGEPAALIDESTGHVYINLSKVESERSIEELVFHEVYTHFGLRQLMGANVSGLMTRLYLNLGKTEFDRLAEKYGVNTEAYKEAYADKPQEYVQAILAEELLAHLAEHHRPAVVRIAQEFVGAVRAWLRSSGFMELAKISETDMRYLLKQSRETVTKGKQGNISGLIYSLVGISKDERAAIGKQPKSNSYDDAARNEDLISMWATISRDEESFQLPFSRKKDFVEIADDLEKDNNFKTYEAPEFAEMSEHGAEKSWRIAIPEKGKAAVYQKGNKVWIDVSDLEQGDGGKRIYNIAANYAFNNGLTFMGDPAGLKLVAQSRRLENMLSSALKFGTTDHLQPHKLQLISRGGVPALKWKKGDTENNILEMIRASYESVKNQFPEIENMVYNPETSKFQYRDSGKEVTKDDLNNLAAAARAFDGGTDSSVGNEPGGDSSSGKITAGRTTIERAILTGSILRGTSSEVSRLLDKLSEQRSERLTGDNAILYSLPNTQTRSQGGFSVSGAARNIPYVRDRILRNEQTQSLPPTMQDSYERLGDKTLVEKLKSQIKRQLTPAGLLPQPVFDLKIARDGEMNAVDMNTRHTLRSFYDAVEKAYGMEYPSLKAGTRREINKVLRGDQNVQLAPSVVQALTVMRDDIKRLSALHLRQLVADAAALRAEGKDAEADSKQRLIETISDNFDTYLNRSYRAFDDPKWPSKVPAKVHQEAVEFLAGEYANGGTVTPDILAKAKVRVAAILTEGTAFESMGAFISEGKLGSKDLSIMKKRKDVPAPIRALLGEYEDATINYAKTVTKMSRLVHNHAFLTSMKQTAFDLGLISETQGEGMTKIAADASEAYAPLNGLYATRDFEQALVDVMGKHNPDAVYDTIVALNGAVKMGKTVLAPTTAFRNFMSSLFFTFANGHFDYSHAAKSVRVMQVYFKDRGPQAVKDYMLKMRKLGVIYDSPYASEMMDLLKDSQLADWVERKESWLAKNAGKALDFSQRFYSMGDDFYKIIGFENEKAQLMEHRGMSEAEAEKEAAERIRNTYPTYSMIGKGVNTLRRFPLVGSFVSFPAEIIRTSYHITRYLKEDIQQYGMKDPIVKRKLAGYAIAAGAIAGISVLSAALAGVGDDEEDAIRAMAPAWQKNSTFLWLWKDDDGNRVYVDLSFLDPYGYWKRPITAVMQDQPLGKAAISGATDLLSPFLSWDIAAKAIGESAFNGKVEGGKVYNEADSAGGIALSVTNHLRKAVQPGIATNVERFILAGMGEKSKTGKPYKTSEEVAALFGWRAATFDPKVALYYQAFEYQDNKSNASKILSSVASSTNSVSEDELRAAYEQSMKARAKAFDDMGKIVNAAKSSGMSNLQLLGALRNSGVSVADARALISGKPPVFAPSKTMMKGSIKKAAVLFDAETQAEFKKREKYLNGLRKQGLTGQLEPDQDE